MQKGIVTYMPALIIGSYEATICCKTLGFQGKLANFLSMIPGNRGHPYFWQISTGYCARVQNGTEITLFNSDTCKVDTAAKWGCMKCIKFQWY